MSDMVDMMLDGILDSRTGEYVGDKCGHPRTRNKVKSCGPNDGEIKRIQKKHNVNFNVAKLIFDTKTRASRAEAAIINLEKERDELSRKVSELELENDEHEEIVGGICEMNRRFEKELDELKSRKKLNRIIELAIDYWLSQDENTTTDDVARYVEKELES